MANNDSALYTLRYNEISASLEAQAGLNWIEIATGSSVFDTITVTTIQAPAATDSFITNPDGQITLTAGNKVLVDSTGMVTVTATGGSVDINGDGISLDSTSDVTLTANINKAQLILSAGNEQAQLFTSGGALTLDSDGSLIIGALATDPATPEEGAIWYNSTDHAWKGYNGTDIGTFDFTPDA